MDERKYTPDQLSAINTRDKTLLVSAAAGSGKTATLTERIIRSLLDPEHPEDIGRMLIVTFTNAAVEELRSRIADALRAAIAKNPENASLERQLMLLPGARICTIDSFCNEVLKRNADKVGMPPNYRIADGAETEILSFAILDALTDAIYEGELPEIASPEEFAALSDTLTSAKAGGALTEIFLNLYEKSKSAPEGVGIYKLLADEYLPEKINAAAVEKSKFAAYAIELLHDAAKHYKNAMLRRLPELYEGGSKTELGYAERISADGEYLDRLISESRYERISEILSAPFEKLPTVKGGKSAAQEEIAAIRKDMKDALTKARDRYFSYTPSEWVKLYSGLYEKLSLLYRVLSKFDGLYTEEKRRRAIAEYSDIERYAYLCLYGENGEKTEIAKALAAEFSAVYIDEYQDVNAMQNMIFEAVSTPTNRFMVGDIKQSIYSFRSAAPEIFRNMKKRFPELKKCNTGTAASIFMSQNFRCDEAIIDFVNGIFDKAFGLTRESIGYVSDDRLTYSKIQKGGEPDYVPPSFELIAGVEDEDEDFEDEDEDGDTPSKTAIARMTEARYVARRISELLSSGKLNSGKAPRPSDIAIIIRENKRRINDYANALAELGIPSEKAEDGNFFLNADVLLALCLLNSIDNPQRDIYLAGLMCSPLYGFTADELYAMRAAGGETLYESLVAYVSAHPEYERGVSFLESLNHFRTLSEGMTVDALISRLFRDTGLQRLAASRGGKENLLLLYNYAKSFEASSYKGLYNFIKFINNVIEKKTEFQAKFDTAAEDSVKILTVHRSKGLEFPIVFYVDTDSAFRDKEARERIAYSEGFGLSLLLRSEDGTALVKNPVQSLIQKEKFRKYFEEELRVVYVALTRAREQLYVVGCIPSDCDAFFEKTELERALLDSYSIYETKSRLSLMLAAKETGRVTVGAYATDGTLDADAGAAEAALADDGRESVKALSESAVTEDELVSRFSFVYPSGDDSSIPEKLSISRLYPEILDEASAESAVLELPEDEGDERREKLPEFYTGTAIEESARRGIATHNFMQFFDIDSLSELGARRELARLCSLGFISEENARRVRIFEIEKFERSDLLSEMRAAKKIYREFRFNTHLEAKYFSADEERIASLLGKEILVQGVIDCLIEDTDGELHLIDYKTDRLTREELSDPSLAEKTLSEKHSLQLSYYKLAIKKIFGKYPKTVRVYSLPLGDTVNIDTLY